MEKQNKNKKQHLYTQDQINEQFTKTFKLISQINQFKKGNISPSSNSEHQKFKNENASQVLHTKLWPAFIHSIKIFKQDPFDFREENLQIVFYLVFLDFFILEEKNKKTILQPLIQRFKKIKTNDFEELKTDKENIKVRIVKNNQLGTNQNETEQKQSFKPKNDKQSLYYGLKQIFHMISVAYITPITIEQSKEMVDEIKSINNLITLQYVLNVYSIFISILVKKSSFQFNRNIEYQITLKFQELNSKKSDSFLQKTISKFVKRSILINSLYIHNQSSKVSSWRLLKLLMRSISFQDSRSLNRDLRLHMHMIHKAAEKQKNTLLAEIIRSKCFLCQAERYSSSSIEKVRIYQAISRKLINSIDTRMVQAQIEITTLQPEQTLFDSQEEEEGQQT